MVRLMILMRTLKNCKPRIKLMTVAEMVDAKVKSLVDRLA